MSTSLGRGADPEPGAHRVRVLGVRAGARAVRRPRPRSARWSPSRCSCGPARAGRRRGWPRPRAGCSTRSACRGPASTGCSPTTCPGWPSAAPGRSSRSPAPGSRTSPSWPTRLRGVPGVLGLEVNISCPNVESRGEVFACDPVAASDVVAAVRAAADPAQPVYAKLSPDVTDIVERRPRGLRRRRRRAVDDQHPARAGHRPRHDEARARRGHRRPVRPGDPPGRAALRLAGAPALPGGADPRHGRHPERPGRAPVRPRRRVGRLGRDGGVQRPVRASPGCTPSWPPRSASAGSPR